MSFVRAGRSQCSHNQGKQTAAVRPKNKTSVSKREWVSTVNDLSVHKLSPEEQSRRHEMHKSNNRAVAQWELKEKALRRRLKHLNPSSPAPLNRASLNIIREVFSNQLQLQDVLARSDKAMAIVKDLFGDAPHRQTGFPSVTMAPDCDSDSELPVVQKPDPPTHLSLLSQSMMDQQALNELESSEDDYSDEGAYSVGTHPKVDRHSKRNGHMVRAKVQNRRAKGRIAQSNLCHQRAEESLPQTPCTSNTHPNPAALNATGKVQRLQSRVIQTEDEEPSSSIPQGLSPDPSLNQSCRAQKELFGNRKNPSSRASRGRDCPRLSSSTLSSLGGNQSSLELLQTMLGQVEAELDSLGPQDPNSTSQGLKQHNTQGLTGFSVALVSTLGRLARILTQKEQDARRDASERERLEEEVKEQRGLIDALTAETLALRDESAAMQGRSTELEHKLDMVVLALLGPEAYEIQDPECTDYESGALGHNGDILQQQALVSPAVLLSHPRQRDNCQHNPEVLTMAVQQEVSVPRPSGSVKSFCSASSGCSLPPPTTTSSSSLVPAPDPPLPPVSQDSLLAQIAELTHQNSLIMAQLRHGKSRSSRVSASPTITAESVSPSSVSDGVASLNGRGRRLSSTSSIGKASVLSASDTGRTTPQSHAEREKELTPGGGEKATQQKTELSRDSSGVSVEQRLLELNRQSAAASSRLLELIEQQRQSASARVSPSVSPIPPSAFSPHSHGTSGDGVVQDVSVFLPEQDSVSLYGGGESRSPCSEVSSQGGGGGGRVVAGSSRSQQVKKQKGEGWFALSTHVR